MSRQTAPAPHWTFAAAWTIWWVNVWYACATIYTPGGWQWGIGTLAAFAWFEFLALRINWRWTLSAVVTWCAKTLSKHDRPGRGWNVIVWLAAFPIGLVVFLLCHVLIEGASWIGIGAGFAAGVPVVVGLHDHWLRPDMHG